MQNFNLSIDFLRYHGCNLILFWRAVKETKTKIYLSAIRNLWSHCKRNKSNTYMYILIHALGTYFFGIHFCYSASINSSTNDYWYKRFLNVNVYMPWSDSINDIERKFGSLVKEIVWGISGEGISQKLLISLRKTNIFIQSAIDHNLIMG